MSATDETAADTLGDVRLVVKRGSLMCGADDWAVVNEAELPGDWSNYFGEWACGFDSEAEARAYIRDYYEGNDSEEEALHEQAEMQREQRGNGPPPPRHKQH